MVSELRSQKQERTALGRTLRAQGKTWVEIADVFRARYRVNARIALRWAHGWSQGQAAGEWNERWPDDLKTNKHFSYWELWPASTGHAPPLDVLNRLAELYHCRLADLLADQADYRHQDSAHLAVPAPSPQPVLSGDVVSASPTEILFLDLLSGDRPPPAPVAPLGSATALTGQLAEATLEEVTSHVLAWAQHMNPNIDRRALLGKLSAAFTVVAAAPFLDAVDADERSWVSARLERPGGSFDEPTLRYCEQAVSGLRRQGDVLGARLTLQAALAHRQVARHLAASAPASQKPRALSVYAELTQLVGWLCFNAGEYRSAQYYYDEARASAHEAQNVELVTYILCTMSHLATWQGRPRVGIDHAVAAQVWAGQAGNPRAVAYAADVSARAFAADRQTTPCAQALDAELAALHACETGALEPSWWYFFDESFYWSTKSECALHLRNPDAALEAIDQAMQRFDLSNVHNLTFVTLERAEAYVQQSNVAAASRAVGEAAVLASVNTSKRIDTRITGLRAALAPHQRSKPVRELDEVLATYRRSTSGNART